jgi:hypothetical protein
VKISRVLLTAVLAFCTTAAVTVSAGDPPPAPLQASEQAKPVAQTLQLAVTISRFNGEKKIGSLPFTVMLAFDGNPSRPTTVQMGSEVPVPTMTIVDGKPNHSYRYQQVGTQINAYAERAAGEGRYNINLSITDSQLLSDIGPDKLPRFQTFKVSNNLILRDGQSIQFVAATDKASGEVAKVEVTMTVVK